MLNSSVKIFLSSLIFLLSSSCSQTIKENMDGKFGGTLRLTHTGTDPKTLNPWIANDASSANYARVLFEGLVTSDPDTDKIIPHFAKSFEINKGGKEIIVVLRDDIFWSDGTKLNVDDVIFTWNTLLRDRVASSSLRDLLTVNGKFPKVGKIDKQTIRFETSVVFAPFLRYLGTEIAPKHHVEKFFTQNKATTLEAKQKLFNNYLNLNTDPNDIVSSGAFKLHKVQRGERMEFVKNPKYFINDSNGSSLPYANKTTYIYTRDNTAAIFKFLAGEVYSLGVTPQHAELIKKLAQEYDYKVYPPEYGSGTSFIWFNLSKNIPEPKYSWFNNKKFREAIAHSIDRESIVNNVFQGLAQPLFTAESFKSPFVNEKLAQGFKRDLDYAQKLLQEAGFSLNNNSELVDKNNNRVEFDLFTNAGNPERELIGVIVSDNLRELGIKVNFKLLEFNNFVGKVMQGKGYEAGLLSLTGSSEPNGGANVWKSSGRLHLFDIKAGQENPVTRKWEKEVDKLFELGVQSLDFATRKQYYDRFQTIIYEYNPLIYLASAQTLTAVNKKLGNIRPTKYGGIMPHMYAIYLKP